jgi:putative MATE family efflux protein
LTSSKNKLNEFINNPSLALWKLSIPMMLGMSVQAIYMLIDTAFIGKWVGGNALAGLGLIFPPMFIIMGITFGLGSGATTVIAQKIGQGEKKQADNAAEHIIILGIILSVLFILIGIFFGDSLIQYQSTNEEVFPHATDYFYTMLLGTPFMVLGIFFRSILSGEGDTLLPMKVLGLGTVINLILDPPFIYYMQIKGAAIATVISQAVVFVIFCYLMILKKHSYISLNLRSFTYDVNIFNKILKLGLPASLSMVIMSIGIFFYNSILNMSEYSTSAIAAYSTAHRIEHLFFIPIISLATSMVTLIGMFYGAKRYDLINHIFYYSIKIGIIISIIFGSIFYFLSNYMLSLFTNDILIINIGTEYFKIFSFAIPFVTITMISSRCMQGLGKAYPMFIITCFRVIIISCSIAYYFIIYLGRPLNYAWVAILISCFLSSIISYIWLLYTKKKILKY